MQDENKNTEEKETIFLTQNTNEHKNKNGRTAAVIRASPKLTEYRICPAPCVHRQCTVVFA